jgi:hypothetical protein
LIRLNNQDHPWIGHVISNAKSFPSLTCPTHETQ